MKFYLLNLLHLFYDLSIDSNWSYLWRKGSERWNSFAFGSIDFLDFLNEDIIVVALFARLEWSWLHRLPHNEQWLLARSERFSPACDND